MPRVKIKDLPVASSIGVNDLLMVYSADGLEQNVSVSELLRAVRSFDFATSYSPTDVIYLTHSSGILFTCTAADLFPVARLFGAVLPPVCYGVGWDNLEASNGLATSGLTTSIGTSGDYQGAGSNYQNFGFDADLGTLPDANEIMVIRHTISGGTGFAGFLGDQFCGKDGLNGFVRMKRGTNYSEQNQRKFLGFGTNAIDYVGGTQFTGWENNPMVALYATSTAPNWSIYTSVGDGSPIVNHGDTGFNNRHTNYVNYNIVGNDDGTEYSFYANGLLLKSITTSLPPPAARMKFYFGLGPGSSSSSWHTALCRVFGRNSIPRYA